MNDEEFTELDRALAERAAEAHRLYLLYRSRLIGLLAIIALALIAHYYPHLIAPFGAD